jgi:hypothetical protein
MSVTAILITLGLIISAILFIRWAGIRDKRQIKTDEDPWDHLSSDSNDKSSKPGFGTSIIKANRNENWEVEPEIGNSASPWLKPNTDTVIFYEHGQIAGPPAAWIEDKRIADHLRKEGLASAGILAFDKQSCTIEITLYDEYEPEIRKKREDNFREKLLKPYTPRQDWTLTFKMVSGLAPDVDVHLRYLDSEEVLKQEDSIHRAIWLEDDNENRISKDSYQNHDYLIRTLRACYSGQDLKIKKIEKGKQNNWELTVGI